MALATNVHLSTQAFTPDSPLMVRVQVFAGADTTAISLRSIFYYLLRDPSKLSAAVAEIDAAAAVDKLSYPLTGRKSRLHLPYVNACIKEALRLHPAVGMLLERHVPLGGAEICGRHIPGGTIVGINPWVVCRDPAVFDQPDDFVPERWIVDEGAGEKAKERLVAMERSAAFVFGAGSRVCMGRMLSWIEMRKVCSQAFAGV